MGCTEGFAFDRIVIYTGLIGGFICTSKRELKGAGLSQRSASPTDRCLKFCRSDGGESLRDDNSVVGVAVAVKRSSKPWEYSNLALLDCCGWWPGNRVQFAFDRDAGTLSPWRWLAVSNESWCPHEIVSSNETQMVSSDCVLRGPPAKLDGDPTAWGHMSIESLSSSSEAPKVSWSGFSGWSTESNKGGPGNWLANSWTAWMESQTLFVEIDWTSVGSYTLELESGCDCSTSDLLAWKILAFARRWENVRLGRETNSIGDGTVDEIEVVEIWLPVFWWAKGRFGFCNSSSSISCSATFHNCWDTGSFAEAIGCFFGGLLFVIPFERSPSASAVMAGSGTSREEKRIWSKGGPPCTSWRTVTRCFAILSFKVANCVMPCNPALALPPADCMADRRWRWVKVR